MLADLYTEVLTGRSILIAFVTVAELRYGALRAGWGHSGASNRTEGITARLRFPTTDLGRMRCGKRDRVAK
jgi:hypothetical protein